jgi:hypothetical protein
MKKMAAEAFYGVSKTFASVSCVQATLNKKFAGFV